MSRYLRENALEDKIAKSEKDLAQVKDKWYKLNRMNPTASQKAEMDKLRKQMGDLVTQIKRDKRELKTGSPGYSKPSKERWQDSDGDGKWYEPGEDVDVNESYLITKGGEEALRKIPLMERIRKNFIGNR